MLNVRLTAGLLLLTGCSAAPEGVAELAISLSPSSFSATVTQLEAQVHATDAKGLIGTGKVTFSADIGTVDPAEATLDQFGSARVAWTCTSGCNMGGRITASWSATGSAVPIRGSRSATFEGTTTVTCVVGTATSTAAATTLSLFGTPIYFDNGAALAAGTYRLKNNGGCIKYGAGQNWTVHAYANGVVSWWIVGDNTSAPITVPPGTIGFERVPGSADRDIGSFADFTQCDNANRALPSRDFTHAGGKLGIWLKDDIYSDNTAGENGRNPSWTLSRVTADCP